MQGMRGQGALACTRSFCLIWATSCAGSGRVVSGMLMRSVLASSLALKA
jgi:hypothetical protein